MMNVEDARTLKIEEQRSLIQQLIKQRDDLKAKLDDAIHDITHCELCGKEESEGCLTLCFECDEGKELRAEVERLKKLTSTERNDAKTEEK